MSHTLPLTTCACQPPILLPPPLCLCAAELALWLKMVWSEYAADDFTESKVEAEMQAAIIKQLNSTSRPKLDVTVDVTLWDMSIQSYGKGRPVITHVIFKAAAQVPSGRLRGALTYRSR